MGFFSWITSDTKRSLPNVHSNRDTFKVHMVTRDGQVYTEEAYDGYGDFNGQDFYELVAHLNGLVDKDMDLQEKRTRGINCALGVAAITNKKVTYRAQGVDFFHWSDEKIHDGKSANELCESGEFFRIRFKDENAHIPKIVERLPECEPGSKEWEQWFDELPKSEACPNQGFFY